MSALPALSPVTTRVVPLNADLWPKCPCGCGWVRGDCAKITLYREIDALGGAVSSEWDRGYSDALNDVLAILERRGFSEAQDAAATVRGEVGRG